MKSYVLDTSAIFALIENEPGVEDVERLLLEAVEGKILILVSVITAIELYYISLREPGKKIADQRLKLVDSLPLRQQPIDPDLTKLVGELKASKSMSLADCCIAGLAKLKNGIIVHKDPEYEHVKHDVKQYKLPYKSS